LYMHVTMSKVWILSIQNSFNVVVLHSLSPGFEGFQGKTVLIFLRLNRKTG
jgi:hypothetical protein